PSNRRAILSSIMVSAMGGAPNAGNTVEYQTGINVSGTVYPLGNPTSIVGATSNSSGNASSGSINGLYIAEAGESFVLITGLSTGNIIGSYPITSVAAAVTTSLVLSAVTGAESGLGVYTGTITGGSSSAFAGYTSVITRFSNASKNGSFLWVASSLTTLTLINVNSISESAVSSAATTNTTYTGTFQTALAGQYFTVAGCVAGNNNGTFMAVGTSNATTLILNNTGGTLAAAQTGTAQPLSSLSVSATIIEFDNTASLKTVKILNPQSGTNTLYTPSGAKNGMLVGTYLLGGVTANPATISWMGIPATNQALTFHYLKSVATTAPLQNSTNAHNGFTMYYPTAGGVIPYAGASGTFAVTASNSVTGQLTGTFAGGANNAFAGYYFVVSGFSNANNNGVFLCTASTA